MRNNIHKNKHLQAAWNKHGENNFQFLVLEYCEISELKIKEQYWIDKTNCCHYNYGYNIATVSGLTVGVEKTQEWREGHSKVMKGRVRPQEERDKISASMKGKQNRLGYKYTDEEKEKRKNSRKEKTKEWSDNQSAAQRNLDKWPHSMGSLCKCEECKEKRRTYNRNRERV